MVKDRKGKNDFYFFEPRVKADGLAGSNHVVCKLVIISKHAGDDFIDKLDCAAFESDFWGQCRKDHESGAKLHLQNQKCRK